MRREVPNWLVGVLLGTLLLVGAAAILPTHGAAIPPRVGEGFSCNLATESKVDTLPPLGLFVHYGPSSLVDAPSRQKWWLAINSRGYARTVARFHPSPDVADGWVDLAKRAGAGYIAITAKHHDGYLLWNSATSTYGVGSQDLLARAARDARRARIGLVVYFSLVDVHAVSYPRDWPTYLRLVKAQLRELMTRYGRIAGVWFDGPGWMLHRSFREWGLPALYAEIHRYQPDAIIVTNHHCKAPLRGEGAAIFEEAIPTKRTLWAQQATYTLSPQWFYTTAGEPMPRREYLSLRSRAKKVGASLLINVPPRPDGSFAPKYVRALLGH